jgi:hypothetical protein
MITYESNTEEPPVILTFFFFFFSSSLKLNLHNTTYKGGCESPRGALNCVKLELSCTTNNTYGDGSSHGSAGELLRGVEGARGVYRTCRRAWREGRGGTLTRTPEA